MTYHNMKKSFILLLLSLSLIYSLHAQTTHHVYSKEIPWNTANETNDPSTVYSITDAIESASPGDEIIIHEGIYREKLDLNKSSITLKNNANDYVLVTGAETVSNWSDVNDMTSGVKVADVSGLNFETDYSQLFSNGKRQLMGRHPNNSTGKMMEVLDPNSGYSLLSEPYKDAGTNANGYVTFESGLPDVDLTNGIVRAMTGKMRNYVYGNISSNSGNSVTFKAINNGVWKNDAAIAKTRHKFSWGYVLHKNLVDTPGEWFIENDMLYYYPHEDETITDTRIEVQVRAKVLVINHQSDITISGINFVAGTIEMQNSSNCTIAKSSMRYLHPFWTPNGYGMGTSEKTGIYLYKCSNCSFNQVYAGHSWGNMITLKEGGNNSFDHCIVEDFGWVGIFTSSIYVNKSNNTSINHSTFGDAGRFQIRISGGDAKVDILDSDFYGSMKMGEDAGPIEATSTGAIGALDMKGSVIAYNKVHDVKGIPVSDGGYNKQKITAFYMEDTENYTAHHNLIYNFKSDNYTGPHSIQRHGEFLYLGPRYNVMTKPVNYYNNTIWNYDYAMSIWNIEIDNWQALGLAPEDSTGKMENGHFANNIYMQDSYYKLSYVRQILSATGGNQGNVKLTLSPSLQTTDFNEYTSYCATKGYQFNPENNVFFDFDDQATHFVDVTQGNFELQTGSSGKNAGRVIDGITNSATPDCGAFEGGDRVLHAGTTYSPPTFMEQEEILPIEESVTFLNFVVAVEQTQSLSFEVSYVADGEKDIVVGVTAPDGTWLANGKQKIQGGEGTSTITVTLPTMPTPGTDYKIVASIRPVGGNSSTAIDTETELLEITGISTGVTNWNEAHLAIYPNPTTGNLHFNSSSPWKIVTILGKVLRSGQSPITDLSSLPNGIYIVKQDSFSWRLIKE